MNIVFLVIINLVLGTLILLTANSKRFKENQKKVKYASFSLALISAIPALPLTILLYAIILDFLGYLGVPSTTITNLIALIAFPFVFMVCWTLVLNLVQKIRGKV